MRTTAGLALGSRHLAGGAWSLARSTLCLLLIATGAQAAPTLESCKAVSKTTVKAPFTVACSGKSDCAATDTLTVTAATNTTPPIAVMCLDFGNEWIEWLPVYDNDKPPQAPLSYPLAPMFAKAIGTAAEAASSAPGRVRSALRRATGARMPAEAVIVDVAGKAYRETLYFDVASLWSGGQLPLGPINGECSPCGFDGTVKLTIPELAAWRRSTNADLTKLQLVLNGTRIPGLVPLYNVNENGGTIAFKLQRFPDKPESMAAWDGLLQSALAIEPGVITVSLTDDRSELASWPKGFTFAVTSFSERLTWAAGALVLLMAVLVAAGLRSKWAFLRDNYDIPSGVLSDEERPAFSLGKLQMTAWTVVIVVGFVLVWTAFRTTFPPINETVVVLLGISVGTAVGALAVVPDIVTKKLAGYIANPSDATAKQELKDLIKSSGIFKDITRDYDSRSIDLHRLQNIVFTSVLMVMFILAALFTGTFPTFPGTLLALMGVSGGAYVGFKAASK